MLSGKWSHNRFVLLFYMSTGTVSLWMTNAQFLQVKKHSLIQELAMVYLLFFFERVSESFYFSSACCAYLNQV